MRIVFMGTPDISAVCLSYLLNDPFFEVVGVISQPDKPKGRGMTLQPTPVKQTALAAGIPVEQPETLKDGALLPLLEKWKPDALAVVAYGKILPPDVLHFPPYGCVNIHVSLLPKYRGAAPMQRAVMAGETKTGVTAILMDEGMDTGDILCSETFSIGENDTFGDVFERSAASGGPLLAKALSALFNKTAVPQKQNHSEATYAQKIAKEETALSFDISASHLHNIIRGLSPVPLGYVKTPDGKLLKIVSSRVSGHNGEGIPGTVLALDPKGEGAVTVACAAGAIDLIRVKPEGKGEMSAADLIRGRKIKIGDVLTQ